MSKREQNLLTILLLTLVVVGFLFVYDRVYKPRYLKAEQKLSTAEQQIETAKVVAETQELIIEEQNWMSKYEPEPVSQQSAQGALQNFCDKEAKRYSMEVLSETLSPPVVTEGAFYHRTQIDLKVLGDEKSFYAWITSLDNPQLFQCVTYLELYPNKADDTKIEAKVVIDKWYVPNNS